MRIDRIHELLSGLNGDLKPVLPGPERPGLQEDREGEDLENRIRSRVRMGPSG